MRGAAQRHLGDRCHLIDDGSEHPHRIALSVHRDEVKRIVRALQEDTERDGVRAQFVVSGMGEFLYLDVLAARAGKRNAMDYVRRLYGVSKERVVVAGDSGNDVLMLEGAARQLPAVCHRCLVCPAVAETALCACRGGIIKENDLHNGELSQGA